MSINLNARQDMSWLFSGSNQGAGSSASSSMSWLGDYAGIKNGSYGKLMKAYYSEASSDRVSASVKKIQGKTDAELKEQKTELSEAGKAADKLKTASETLLKKGKDSVFEKEEDSAVYDAVSSFVKGYNDTLKAAAGTLDKNVGSRVNSMTGNTAVYTKQLANIGITIGEDKTLSIDKDTFMSADKSKVQSLFQGNGSFAYQTSAQASLLSMAAENAVSATGLYSASGNNSYSTGNLFNNFF